MTNTMDKAWKLDVSLEVAEKRSSSLNSGMDVANKASEGNFTLQMLPQT
jgi:hypothetical protein